MNPNDALVALLADYADCIDRRTLNGLERVFTADCQISFGDVEIAGRDALLRHLGTSLAHYRATKHVMHTPEAIDATERGDSPVFRTQVTAWHDFEGDRPSLTLHGYYYDTLVLTDERWRIAKHVGGEVRRERGAARPPD